MNHLEDWGYTAHDRDAFASIPNTGCAPARVVEEQRDGYRVVCAAGVCRAQASGRLRHHTADRTGLPAVGDWVALTARRSEPGGVIHAVLPRRSQLLRHGAGRVTTAQVIAANVDVVLLVTSLNSDLEPRRIERYLAAIWESGAVPAIVLNKSDLCPEPEAARDRLGPIALGVEIHVVSALAGEGLAELDPYLAPGRTIALVGSSGVGKSTLVNALAGDDVQFVREIRSRDERGQHTTTARRLLRLPSGALWVDTPGMREFGLWNAEDGVDGAFDDVATLAGQCRFNDCQHRTEPGCAILAAIAAGTLRADRLAAYDKLQRELAFVGRKQSQAAQAAQKQINRKRTKSYRARTQARKRRREIT